MSYGWVPRLLFPFRGVPSAPRHRRMLGEKIRLYRKLSGFSQETLAEKAELAPTYISDLERGRVNISVDALMRMAKALDVPITDFFRGI